jgi:hypothetical protein
MVTKKESGMRCIGEARGTWGEVQESSLEACSKTQQSVSEHGRAQVSMAECK